MQTCFRDTLPVFVFVQEYPTCGRQLIGCFYTHMRHVSEEDVCIFEIQIIAIVPYNKKTRCTNFTNLFWNENLQVSESSSVHHQEFFTVHLLLLLPLTLQPTVGFGLSNNVLPFFPICHQLSPSSHSQHLKISFYFLFPSFPGSSPSSRPFQFFSEDLFGHPVLLHSL